MPKVYRLVTAQNPQFNSESGKFTVDFCFETLQGKTETVEIFVQYPCKMRFCPAQKEVLFSFINFMIGNYTSFSERTKMLPLKFQSSSELVSDVIYSKDIALKYFHDHSFNVKYFETEAEGAYRMFTESSKIAVSFSGGCDSTLTIKILEYLGYNAEPVSVVKIGDFDATTVQMVKGRCAGINSNFIETFHRLPNTGLTYERIQLYPHHSLLLLIQAPYLNQHGYKFLISGNEFGDCARIIFEGLPVYGKNDYDQGNLFKRKLTKYFSTLGWDLQSLSIIEPLSVTGVFRMLNQLLTSNERSQIFSCFYPREGRPCNDCLKCYRLANMIESIGGQPEEWGYATGKNWQDRELNPLELFNSCEAGDDFEHMCFKLRSRWPSKPSKLPAGHACPHVEKIQYHALNANIYLELPDKLKAFYTRCLE